MDHAERMQRKKALQDEKNARATTARGVVLVHTGNGKGKSTAAFGVLARALGHDLTAAVVQFVKQRETGEARFFRQAAPQVRWRVMGEGFSWETQDRERDRAAAEAAWAQAAALLAEPDLDLVVLDELNIALKQRLLPLDAVLGALAARPAGQHVVITGRGAPPELLALADTATEMTLLKHAYAAGVQAMPGVEF